MKKSFLMLGLSLTCQLAYSEEARFDIALCEKYPSLVEQDICRVVHANHTKGRSEVLKYYTSESCILTKVRKPCTYETTLVTESWKERLWTTSPVTDEQMLTKCNESYNLNSYTGGRSLSSEFRVISRDTSQVGSNTYYEVEFKCFAKPQTLTNSDWLETANTAHCEMQQFSGAIDCSQNMDLAKSEIKYYLDYWAGMYRWAEDIHAAAYGLQDVAIDLIASEGKGLGHKHHFNTRAKGASVALAQHFFGKESIASFSKDEFIDLRQVLKGIELAEKASAVGSLDKDIEGYDVEVMLETLEWAEAHSETGRELLDELEASSWWVWSATLESNEFKDVEIAAHSEEAILSRDNSGDQAASINDRENTASFSETSVTLSSGWHSLELAAFNDVMAKCKKHADRQIEELRGSVDGFELQSIDQTTDESGVAINTRSFDPFNRGLQTQATIVCKIKVAFLQS